MGKLSQAVQMKLINREPTQEMVLAGEAEINKHGFLRMDDAFRAMYDAAPEVQQEHFDKFEVFVKHDKIYFAISNQSFQLAFIPEDEPDMSAGQVAEWYMDQVRHALSRLQSPDAQAEIAKRDARIAELIKECERFRQEALCAYLDDEESIIAKQALRIEELEQARGICPKCACASDFTLTSPR